MLPKTDELKAGQITEHCFEVMKKLNLPNDPGNVDQAVTISAGICSLVTNGKTPSSAILAAADKLLYKAKNQGHNRFEQRSKVAGTEVGNGQLTIQACSASIANA